MAPYGLARHNRNQMITPYRGGKCISGYWDIGDATLFSNLFNRKEKHPYFARVPWPHPASR